MPGASVLRYAGGGAIIAIEKAADIRLTGLTLAGEAKRPRSCIIRCALAATTASSSGAQKSARTQHRHRQPHRAHRRKKRGSGQNGNGVNVFRAGSVIVSNIRIADCAFSAIRSNSGSNCQMIGNSCARLGEVALYAAFAFEGAVIANNIVDKAAMGISSPI